MIRTRFAPSPTGDLHLGGARTALFNWLFAQHLGGEMILRIEDTDLERSSQAAVNTILEGLAWLGLSHAGEPIYQTDRFDRYRAFVDQLLDQGKAYRCQCSKERLAELREGQLANQEKPRYDGRCRDLDLQDTPGCVVRFRQPQAGVVRFEDQVLGHIEVPNSELDDLIIARSDGTPTYNFTVVVDDWEMGITHVIRGMDHISNTPRQIHLFNALGATAPSYGHIPMILGSDGKKLSKRHGALSVLAYRDAGYLPEAMMNYLARLGWGHGDQEIFSQSELVQYFDLAQVSHSAASFNEDKLAWLNQHYLRTLPADTLLPVLRSRMQSAGLDDTTGPPLSAVLPLMADRAKTLNEWVEVSQYFYAEQIAYDDKALRKHLTADALPVLSTIHQQLSALSTWTEQAVHQVITDVSASLELKLGKVAQPIRVAVTGGTASPPLAVTLQLLGRERCLARIMDAIGLIEASAASV